MHSALTHVALKCDYWQIDKFNKKRHFAPNVIVIIVSE